MDGRWFNFNSPDFAALVTLSILERGFNFYLKNSSLRQRRREDVERSDDRRVYPPYFPTFGNGNMFLYITSSNITECTLPINNLKITGPLF